MYCKLLGLSMLPINFLLFSVSTGYNQPKIGNDCLILKGPTKGKMLFVI